DAGGEWVLGGPDWLPGPVGQFGRHAGPVFFFQAEDGIRALHVTGVQTCALPIYWAGVEQGIAYARVLGNTRLNCLAGLKPAELRSEERRVGKGCRSRWAAGFRTRESRTGADNDRLDGQDGQAGHEACAEGRHATG